MPIFRVRLESQEDDEFRLVAVAAETEAEAKEIALAKEQKFVAFEIPQERVDELEKDEADGKLSGREKAHLFAHRQQRPYKVKSVAKRDD